MICDILIKNIIIICFITMRVKNFSEKKKNDVKNCQSSWQQWIEDEEKKKSNFPFENVFVTLPHYRNLIPTFKIHWCNGFLH